MIYIVAFVVFLLIGLPISFVTVLTAFSQYVFTDNIPTAIFSQRLFAGSSMYLLLSIPFFMFAGNLMNTSGITHRIINISKIFVGRVRGGLAMINVIASMFFGGISGSSNADTAAIGSVLIPAMKEEGYDAEFSTGITVTSSCIGSIIPPSITMVTYGVVAEVSVGTMFVSGVVPGILLGLGLIVVVFIVARGRNYPRYESRMTLRESLLSIQKGTFALFMPVLILGGIVGGVFTPTEAAGVSVVYALVVGFFIHRELTIKKLIEAAKQTVKLSAMIMLIIAAANVFRWVLIFNRVPETITYAMLAITKTKAFALLIMNIIMLLMGMILGPSSNVIILAPIFLQVAEAYDINLIHLGIVMVLNLNIGLFTPPMGTCLFTGCAIAKISLYRLLRYGLVIPLLGTLAILVLVTYVPWVVHILPNLLGVY